MEKKINKLSAKNKKKSLTTTTTNENLGELLNPSEDYGKNIEFSIDGLGDFEAITISPEVLGTEHGIVDRKFFFSDKWKNLKGEMEQKGYKQPTREEFSKLVKSAGGIEKLDELIGGSLSIPGVRLEIDKESRCRPFAVNHPYFQIFRDGIVYDGYKHWLHFKSTKIGEDRVMPARSKYEDFSYLYRDHEKGRVLFIKEK